MPKLDNDRNLLFGVIAHQLGIVSRNQLLTVMNQWVERRDDSLPQLMAAQGWISDDEQTVIESFVDLHLARHDDFEQSLSKLPSMDSLREDLSQISSEICESTLSTWPTNGNGGSRIKDFSHARFKILRPLARGGLGQVSVAMDGELQREVALKEMQFRFADDPNNRSRFIREAEITGALEHPAIVPVYGCGQYSDGRPFFAMRLIRGHSLKKAIQEFHQRQEVDCRSPATSLELKKQLGRFLHVCNAVDYAHSRGVLHRDIKPSNIMLGDFGETLLVDWGLSKPLDETDEQVDSVWDRLTSPGSMVSKNGSTVGTPAYMSPEQANGDCESDVRSDVFSLGATLYCILTNRPPNSDETPDKVLDRAKQADFCRVRELNRHLPKALDAICAKAMARFADDRYESARVLADDVERWIADEPTSAYRESISERLTRWTRRHRAWAVSGLLALIVIAGISISAAAMVNRKNTVITRQKQEAVEMADYNGLLAEREKDAKTQALANEIEANVRRQEAEAAVNQFEEVLDYLVEAFRNPDPRRAGQKITVAEILDNAVDSIDFRFVDNPLAKASVLNAIAKTYRGLKLPGQGLATAEAAHEIRQRELGESHFKTIESKSTLGQAYYFAGKMQQAKQTLESTLELAKTEIGEESLIAVICLNDLSLVYRKLGQLEKSIEFGEKAVTLGERVFGTNHTRTLRYMHNLANGYLAQGETTKALGLSEKSTLLREQLGNQHPTTLAALKGLALIYADSGRAKEAISLFKEVVEVETKQLGADHFQTVVTLGSLANSLLQAGKLAEAIGILEGIVRAKQDRQTDPRLFWETMILLGKSYAQAGRYSDALPLFEQTLELTVENLGETNVNTVALMNNVASVYRKTDKLDEALALQERAYNIINDRLPNDHPLVLQVINNLSLIYLDLDRTQDAIGLISDAIGEAGERIRRGSPIHFTLLTNLADGYVKSDQLDRAIALHSKGLALKEQDLGRDHPSTIASARSLMVAFRKADKHDRAFELIATHEKNLPKGHPVSASFLKEAGQTFMDATNWQMAITYNEKAYQLHLEIFGEKHELTIACLENVNQTREKLQRNSATDQR